MTCLQGSFQSTLH